MAAPTANPAGFFGACARMMVPGSGTCPERIAIELQNLAGEEVTFGKTRAAGPPGVHASSMPRAARRGHRRRRSRYQAAVLAAACGIRPEGSVPDDWSSQEARDEFIRFAQRRALGPSTAALVRAAERNDIPWLRLNDQSLVQLGHGKYQQRIQATVTSRTSHIAVELASDKENQQDPGDSRAAGAQEAELVQSERQAVRAAQRIGFPVVTKPYNGNHGRGISIRLTTDEEVARALPWRANIPARSSSRPSWR